MPRSKRNKVVSLTKTVRKTKDAKTILFEKIRAAADAHEHLYILKVSNMRNSILQNMRHEMKQKDGSIFFFGNNRVISKALGEAVEQEYKAGMHKLCPLMKGEVGLLFTGMQKHEVENVFEKFVVCDFARNGNIANLTISVEHGSLKRRVEPFEITSESEVLSAEPSENAPFPNNMETQLRSLGMPTALKQGSIVLLRDFVICEKGKVLSSAQAHLLKLFNLKTATFLVSIEAHWSEKDGFSSFLSSEMEE